MVKNVAIGFIENQSQSYNNGIQRISRSDILLRALLLDCKKSHHFCFFGHATSISFQEFTINPNQ